MRGFRITFSAIIMACLLLSGCGMFVKNADAATVNTDDSTSEETPDNSLQVALVATPTEADILVNGEAISFDSYNILDHNYFKLRDIAYAINGSEQQFGVRWDGSKNAIILKSQTAYTSVGGEMGSNSFGAKTPTPTSSKLYLDNKEITLTAYNIDGNNYFKLRDIGKTFDFSVEWDGQQNAILIDTGRGYTDE